MEDKEIEKLYQKELEEEKRQREFEKRVEKLAKIRHHLQSPKGFFRTKCPKCGARLKFERVYGVGVEYFKCPNVICGYEYASLYIPGI